MTRSLEPPPPGFDALLSALRAVGLPVGAREVLRLHHVFALAPGLGQDRPPDRQLRDLLATALTHGPDERRRFDQVYKPWAERWQEWERRADPGAEPGPVEEKRPWAPFSTPKEPPPEKEGRGVRWRRIAAVAAAVVVLVAAVAAMVILGPDAVVQVEPPASETPRPDDDSFRILTPEPPTTFTEWVPTLEVVREGPSPRSRAWPPIVLGALALALTGGLAWRWARKPLIPEVLPEPLPGPLRLPLLPLSAAGHELLDADAARTLVWGVGRHVAEELTPELDLEATVRETARGGGLPALRYAPEKRLREVWLWLDGTVDDPAMERWAEEIAASLARAGLPVRIGGFDGYPRELLWDEGQLFRPEEVEAHRQTALVAVCTDGAVLARHLEDERGPAVRVLLRALAAWPRLALVDFSQGAALAAAVRPLGLDCVAPDDLPAFFGVGRAPEATPREEVDPGELRAWRAALALGSRPVDRATAYALRRELGFELSPWAYHLLRGAGEERDETLPRSVGGGLMWEAEGRAALLAWLAEASRAEPSGLRQGSLLDRALLFWERRFAEEADERGRRGPLDPWEDRPAERHLRMERALLRLWRQPAEAAEELFGLRSDELEEALRGRLGELAPRDCAGSEGGLIPLPWRLADLTDRARFLLSELGLGGVRRGELRRPGRLGWALGLMASLGLALLGLGVREMLLSPEGTEPTVRTEGPEPPADARPFRDQRRLGEGKWSVLAGTPRGRLAQRDVGPGTELRLTWQRIEESPCVDGSGEAQLWRCGSSPLRATTRDVGQWPRRSVASLAAPAGDPAARALAAALIDSGSADAVSLGLEANSRLAALLGGPGSGQASEQLLYIRSAATLPEPPAGFQSLVSAYAVLTADDLSQLTGSIARMDGNFTIDQVWAPWLDEPKDQSRVTLSHCPWQEGFHEASGVQFLRICGGTFRMGSEKDEEGAYPDQQPAHDVTVGGFWMGQTEVTNRQYRVFQPKHPADDERPATGVTWFDARDYCRSLGESEEWEYDLPTEAEWEHAARAGTKSAWSFGDDEAQLKDFAWYGEGLDGRTHPVGQKKPNPWGLYDVHGNVWEWVLDCWNEDAYRQRARDTPIPDPGLEADSCHQADNRGTSGARRVVRGGSFVHEPGALRSAAREWNPAGDSDPFFGFRCVRRPRRQLDPSTL